MTAQICESCKHIHDRCYCSPNSTCEKYEPATKAPLTWNVYRYSINGKEVKPTNIFDHWKFDEDVQADLRRCQRKSDFAERLRRNLFYYFGSKCEHEIIVSSWPYTDEAACKIDIYQQVMLNFEIFCDYVWSKRGAE